ncbi:CapA family protein [Streptomyces cadmiisoli]|uniref:CapA family protein n=1 Tax=Streptomyces cadmiisoli TaxID=2184053 RepID=UPI003D755B0D
MMIVRIARRRQMALAVTALLAAAAACQARIGEPPARSGHPGPAAPRAFTLVASGGVLPHPSVVDRARFDAGGAGGLDFRPLFAGALPVVSRADLALCHLEPGYDADGAGTGGPPTRTPPELAQALAAVGYDGCSVASEDGLAAGADGVRHILDALDRAGIRHAGAARSEGEARTVTIMPAGPAMVAHLAYTQDSGGPALPAGQSWAVGLIDEGRIVADARAARQAGADVVVVSLHWGTAGQDEPDARQLALADALTAASSHGRPDIDLIVGGHAHVPQAYEKVNGTWVIYGTGDQVTGQPADRRGAVDPRGNQSTIGRFTFAPPTRPGGRWEVTTAEFIPQMYDMDAGRVVDLDTALARGADVAGVRERIQQVVLGRGAADDGLVMGTGR